MFFKIAFFKIFFVEVVEAGFLYAIWTVLLSVLPACIDTYHMHALCSWRSEEGVESTRTQVR